MPINLSEIVNDPDFAQPFVITRSQGGAWTNGIWTNVTVTVNAYGVIQPATNKELEMIPDGDRSGGEMMFHTSTPLYETHVNPESGTSDILTWRGTNYRILKVMQWQDFGYWQALACRMTGA